MLLVYFSLCPFGGLCKFRVGLGCDGGGLFSVYHFRHVILAMSLTYLLSTLRRLHVISDSYQYILCSSLNLLLFYAFCDCVFVLCYCCGFCVSVLVVLSFVLSCGFYVSVFTFVFVLWVVCFCFGFCVSVVGFAFLFCSYRSIFKTECSQKLIYM